MKKTLVTLLLLGNAALAASASAVQMFDFDAQAVMPAAVGGSAAVYGRIVNGAAVASPLPLDFANFEYTIVVTGLVQDTAGATSLFSNGTVTICHSRTPDLASHTRNADILVAAVGRTGLIGAAMVKPGACVIDVGTNRQPDGKLRGDVDFEAVRQVAGSITPVPGGVGPMTVAMLVANALRAAERRVQ